MPKTRFPIPDIKSYSPALDVRGAGNDVYVLEGRNYVFDSKGPKSGFATRLLAGGDVIGNPVGIAQSIDIADRCFVAVPSGIYELSANESEWVLRLDLSGFDQIPYLPHKKWTAAYLSAGVYFCHPDYGFYKLTFNGFTQLTDETVPGLPYKPIAVVETNGRLVILSQYYSLWSAPAAAEDLNPTLGGAGFQLLSDRVTGQPIAIAAFQRGFLIWTDQDCLVGEFIGGDNVFRFDRATNQQIPLDANCIDTLPDGSQIICTEQGLYLIKNGQEPEKIAPIFSEFLREVLKHEPSIRIRLTYAAEQDRLYVQLRDYTNHYVRTYVLAVALDKWGQFSDRHLGIIKYKPERGAYGYVDNEGVAHKFKEFDFNREVTPHVFTGLDSSITVGYIKPPNLTPEADTLQEMHEILIGGKARPSWSVPEQIDLGIITSFQVQVDYITPFYYALGQEREIQEVINPNNNTLITDEGYPTVSVDDESPPEDVIFTPEVLADIFANGDNGITFVLEYNLNGVYHDSGPLIRLQDVNFEQQITIQHQGYAADYATESTTSFHTFSTGTSVITDPNRSNIGFSDFWFLDGSTADFDFNDIIRVAVSIGYKANSEANPTVNYAINGGALGESIELDYGFNDHWTSIDSSWLYTIVNNLFMWDIASTTIRKVELYIGKNDTALQKLSARGLNLSCRVEPPFNSSGVWKAENDYVNGRSHGSTARAHVEIVPSEFAKIGIEYTGFVLQGYGGTPPYTYSAVGLPTGMSIDSNTGAVHGIPTELGDFAYTITVTDSSSLTSVYSNSITVKDWLCELLDVTVEQNGQDASNISVVTFSDISIRASDPGNKYLLICANMARYPLDVNDAASSVTVNGVAATSLDSASPSTTTVRRTWIIEAPEVDTVDVVFTTQLTAVPSDGNLVRMCIYRLHGFNPVPTDSAIDINSGGTLGAKTISVDVPQNHLVVANGMVSNDNVPTAFTTEWTGITKDTEAVHRLDLMPHYRITTAHDFYIDEMGVLDITLEDVGYANESVILAAHVFALAT